MTHTHISEAYDVRDGKLYRNDRLANQIDNQPLHFDQPVDEQAAGPRMLTFVGIWVILCATIAIGFMVWW